MEFHTDRNVTELLFHPANFDDSEHSKLLRMHSAEQESMPVDHYRELVDQINDIYRRIGNKLSTWRKNGQGKRNRCDASANTEICNLVADFFLTLEWSEGDDFHLFYDDLPIYYVPSEFKDKLYLMANLFTK